MAKTTRTDVPVADFLATVENSNRRADAKAVQAMLTDVTGEAAAMWGPSIVGFGSYKGPTGDWPIIGFSPRKAQLVLYIMRGFTGSENLLGQLGKHKSSGGCIYVNRLTDIDLDVLREISKRSVDWMRAQYPA